MVLWYYAFVIFCPSDIMMSKQNFKNGEHFLCFWILTEAFRIFWYSYSVRPCPPAQIAENQVPAVTCRRHSDMCITLLYAPASPLDPSKLINLPYLDSFCMGGSFSYISLRIFAKFSIWETAWGSRYDRLWLAHVTEHYMTLYHTVSHYMPLYNTI